MKIKAIFFSYLNFFQSKAIQKSLVELSDAKERQRDDNVQRRRLR